MGKGAQRPCKASGACHAGAALPHIGSRRGTSASVGAGKLADVAHDACREVVEDAIDEVHLHNGAHRCSGRSGSERPLRFARYRHTKPTDGLTAAGDGT